MVKMFSGEKKGNVLTTSEKAKNESMKIATRIVVGTGCTERPCRRAPDRTLR